MRLSLTLRLAGAVALAASMLSTPVAAQSAKPAPQATAPTAPRQSAPTPSDDPAMTCAMLFNWVARFGEGLEAGRQQRLYEQLSTIADPQVYSVPSQTDCASILQIMVQENGEFDDLGLHDVLGISAQCDSVVPFVQQRYLALAPQSRETVMDIMETVQLPLYGRSDDLMACAILHGTLDRLNLFEVMQEF